MEKCNCYHEEYGKPECWGTKEKDVCSCKGDETKCSFYPNKRAAALADKAIADFYAKEVRHLESQINTLEDKIKMLCGGTTYFNVFTLDEDDLKALIEVRKRRIKDYNEIRFMR